MPPKQDDGAAAARKRRRYGQLSVFGLLVAAVAGWLVLHPPSLTPVPPAPAPSPVAPPGVAPSGVPPSGMAPAQAPRPRPFDIITANEATILAARPTALEVFRFDADPHVLVLSFPSLHEQGRMLDRLGAFVEKAGLPHDRVLDEADLQAAIRLSGDTPDTYYYGHDYRAADMARFFALADRDGIALHPEEETLRRLLTQEGMLVPGAVGALISLPPESQTPPIDAAARATILHHELSHGAYFTDPAYAAYSRNFWQTVLTETQREGFRRFLGSEGYDETNEDLMLNEAQAYLVHTADPRYFRPEYAGLSDAEAARLRGIFLAGMPVDWLKTATPVSAQ
jgi:hypothetical protein